MEIPGPPPQGDTVRDHLLEESRELTTGVLVLPRVADVHPVVVIKETTIPLFGTGFAFTPDTDPVCMLPIGAFATSGRSRIVVLGHIGLLGEVPASEGSEFGAMLENAIRTCGGADRARYRVLRVGVPPMWAQKMDDALKGTGMKLDNATPGSSFSSYHVVIITTSAPELPQLHQYIEQGGGVIIGDVSDVDRRHPQLDALLYRLGIGFPPSALVAVDNGTAVIKLKSTSVSDCYLQALVQRFCRDAPSCAAADLERLVVTLKYHLDVMPRSSNPAVLQLAEVITSSLKGDDTLGLPIQPGLPALIASFAASVFERVPAGSLSKLELAAWDGPPAALHEVAVEVGAAAFCSTGVWLPPGVLGSVEVREGDPTGTFVQVGCCSVELVQDELPWGRYPVVVQQYECEAKGPTLICNPHGGIVYLASVAEGKRTLSLVIEGGLRHPCFSQTRREEVGENSAPWAEVDLKYAIFSGPTASLAPLDYAEIGAFYAPLFEKVVNFLGEGTSRPARFVFDNGVAQSVVGYPTTLPLDMVMPLFVHRDKEAVACLVRDFAWQCMSPRPGCDAHIPAIATYHVFGMEAVGQVLDSTRVFEALRSVYEAAADKHVFARALRASKDWPSFVRLLGQLISRDLRTLLDHGRSRVSTSPQFCRVGRLSEFRLGAKGGWKT